MIDLSTISYYDTHAAEYAEKTRYVYMHDTRAAFLNLLDPTARIADLGCGGGRDMKIFEELGYQADGIDASPEMCRVASEYTGNEVKCLDLCDWQPLYTYGGIWISSSLSHLDEAAFYAFFRRIGRFLGTDGVLYFSMKTEIADGYDEYGRYYLGFSDHRLSRILADNPQFERVRYWQTKDNLGRELVWANVILRRT